MSGNGAYPGGPGGPAAPGAPEPRSVIDPGAPPLSRRRRRDEQVATQSGPTVAGDMPAFAASVIAAAPQPGPVRAPSPVRTSAPGQNPLGPAFAGTPASTGARLVAFTLDAILIGIVTVAVLLGTRSLVLAAVVALQLAIGFCVALARTGATPGHLMLRLRASRDDAPFSPGTGRAFVRALVTGFGFVVGIGSWVVVASSAWDAGGRRRSWADRAAGTVVVAVPRGGAVVAPAAATTVAPPLVFNTSVRPAVDDDAAPIGSAAVLPQAPAAVVPVAPAAVAPVPRAQPVAPVVPVAPALPVAPVAAPAPAGESVRADPSALLLIFDTGQRVRIELPAAVNLGRRPAPSEPGDLVVAVEDPDSTVSKTHLRLEHSRGRTWATDLGSTNGSGVFADDGRRSELAPGARTLLDDGDRVRIGDRTFTVNELLPDGGERGASA
ncbi:RDD family protein [Microbacterium sp. NPDC089698]|uniref:RDD family protein n=1 Tax=Microbacterium sp. NPDC089698 TaxID=3364200 RepID=UPI0037FAB99B